MFFPAPLPERGIITTDASVDAFICMEMRLRARHEITFPGSVAA